MAYEISNLYEQMVIDRITERFAEMDHEEREDMACVALNHLPAKYYRHGVDLVYYMSSKERAFMDKWVDEAIESARKFVEEHRGR